MSKQSSEYSPQEIEKSLYTGFIDRAFPSSPSLRPRLIINNREKHQKVLLTIQSELSSCTQFDIAVAFITRDGIASLLQTLLEASQRGVREGCSPPTTFTSMNRRRLRLYSTCLTWKYESSRATCIPRGICSTMRTRPSTWWWEVPT